MYRPFLALPARIGAVSGLDGTLTRSHLRGAAAEGPAQRAGAARSAVLARAQGVVPPATNRGGKSPRQQGRKR